MNISISEAAKSGIICGIIAGIMSGSVNYYLVPFPATPLDNGIGHGITGLISGFMGGFLGLIVFMIQHTTHKGTMNRSVKSFHPRE